MIRNSIYISLLVAIFTATGLSQPTRPPGPPPGGMRAGNDGPGVQRPGDWIKPHDKNNNGVLEREEFNAAVQSTFAELDRDRNGTLEGDEIHHRGPRPGQMQTMGPQHEGPMRPKLLPPFFVHREGADGSMSNADFAAAAGEKFSELDIDGSGTISAEEARKAGPPPPPMQPGRPGTPPPAAGPPPPPNAEFIGAEMRFGEKLVSGHPFSAEIVIEDTRRLYDGSITSKQSRGAIYRDGSGRVRREQPLEMIGGVNIVGSDNHPQVLVFISDIANRSQIFLDLNNKIARTNKIIGTPPPEPPSPTNAKTEELGTKTIEGVSAVGTRNTFEIRLPGGKTAQATSERWFSPDLQTVVMSRHLDPMSGEHVFKLVNIKLAEPAANLFAVPTGFRVESRPGRHDQ
jgi:hypothetical protein